MNNLQKRLNNYIAHPGDYVNMFELANEYKRIGQTASAISFYLKTAENSSDLDFVYTSLLLAASCFEDQGNRVDSVCGLVQQAIIIYPDRPEAYFILSRFYERNTSYMDAYMISCLAIKYALDDIPKPLPAKLDYPGFYGIIFERAVSAWWVGRYEESRDLFLTLKENYTMDELHTKSVEDNLNQIGFPGHINRYFKDSMKSFRLKFNGIESVEQNYAQVYQDMFVLWVTEGKREGSYLEIGSSDPFYNSNTALLETKFDWKGISIDINRRDVANFREKRKNVCLLADATKVNYSQVLEDYLPGLRFIDYLQLDCDPPAVTYQILTHIPFDSYNFGVITFEHDHYLDANYRKLSRDFLISKGYFPLVKNVSFYTGRPFEDWWVNEKILKDFMRIFPDSESLVLKDFVMKAPKK